MKTIINYRFLLISFAFAGFLLLSGKSFAQQESEDQSTSKKTITIHVTKEVDGNTITIDTTIVTEGDFDADAFLEERGVMNDMPEITRDIEQNMIIRRPWTHEFNRSESNGESPDTLILNDDTIIMLSDVFDMPLAPPDPRDMPFKNNFDKPDKFPDMRSPRMEEKFEDMVRSMGLDNVMPFGEMKKVVVKKKRNGKKLIITFEDRGESSDEPRRGNKNEERVIIYKNKDQSMAPQNEEHVKIEGQPGRKMIIHRKVEKTGNGDQVMINAEVDKPAPGKKEKKVIIIKEEKTK